MIADLLPVPLETRCLVCGAQANEREPERPGWQVCRFCGAQSRAGAEQAGCAAELAKVIDGAPFPEHGTRTWFTDAYTARIALTARGRWLEGEIAGHDDVAPRGPIVPLHVSAPPTVGLVVLARAGANVAPFLAAHGHLFDAVTLVRDGEGPDMPGATTVRRPLADDFGAQRNAGMAASPTDWAFHLDLDESVDAALAAALPHLAARAGAAGLRAVGLPRLNRVDGRTADLFPDVQYRLVRGDERFQGRVHERPAACADWPRTTIALAGSITHHLSGAHVRERDAAYERLGQNRERREDVAALLRPLAG